MRLLKHYQTNMNLMRIIAILFLILIFFFLSNCASLQNYFMNRGNDLKDIVHIGVEKDVYGASIFVDSIGLGIQHAANGKGIGMRYGTVGLYKTGGKKLVFNSIIVKNNHPCEIKNTCLGANGMLGRKEISMYGNSFLIINTNFHEPITITNRTKFKSVYMKMYINPGVGKQYTLIYEFNPKEDNRGDYIILPVEISIGMYLGIRLGFNFSELADFIVGFVGFDPLGDDIAGIPQPAMLDKNWENNMDTTDKQINEIKTPIISMQKSKFFNNDDKEFHHCNLPNVCINYRIKKYSEAYVENQCYKKKGSIGYNKCWDLILKTIAFCQFPDYEKIYLYEDGLRSLDEVESDCKLLKGEFVK